MSRSKAAKSARLRRSAKNAAVFMTASFSATAVATILIDADAVGPRSAFNLRLDRARQPQGISALGTLAHVPILFKATAGVHTLIPNRDGISPKSRVLKVTMAAAWPFTAASSTSSSA